MFIWRSSGAVPFRSLPSLPFWTSERFDKLMWHESRSKRFWVLRTKNKWSSRLKHYFVMSFLEYKKTPGSSCCLGMNSIGFGHLRKIKLGRLVWFQQNSATLFIACPQLWHNFWTTTVQTHPLPTNTGFPPTLEGSPMQSSFCVHRGWPIANFGNLKSHILRMFSCFVKLTTRTIHFNMTNKIHYSLTNKTSTNFTQISPEPQIGPILPGPP